ncbi:uncharacterized [Tachysurus ichikawai]
MYGCPPQQILAFPQRVPLRSVLRLQREKHNGKDREKNESWSKTKPHRARQERQHCQMLPLLSQSSRGHTSAKPPRRPLDVHLFSAGN